MRLKMKIDLTKNYTIISNHIDQKLLNNFSDYTIINDDINYDKLENMIYSYPSNMF